uniref:RNase H type-1 domain-containing protein n=1 Tax=Hyaloperonospora arabidopsidis (strain Emoy2) TaxID=559515 RepID=M4BCN6_HYAAE
MSLNTGLVQGLRQAQASDYTLLHVIGDSALVLSQLRARHPPRKQHLLRLFQEARAIANDINVSSWEYHYRTYNKMADRQENIAMDTGASMQAHAPFNPGLVKEATVFLDSDVNHWLETLQAEQERIQGP